MKNEPEKNENIVDYRQLGQTKLYFKKQNKYMFMTDLEIYNFEEFSIKFPTPNVVSMFLNIGESEYLKSRKIYETKLKHVIKPKGINEIEFKNQIILYDYFEHTQMSIICAYNAIEAFANVAIPEDHEYSFVNNKGIKEIWNKEAILRWMSLSDKLTKILPNLRDLENPNTKPFWSDFKQLEKLRNGIIHPKQHSKELNVRNEAFKSFFDKKLSKWIFSTDKILKYFCQGKYREYYFPYGYGPSEQEQTELSDFNEYFEETE